MATVDTTGLLAGGSETASLTVLVHGVDDPVDAGVTADGLVLGAKWVLGGVRLLEGRSGLTRRG